MLAKPILSSFSRLSLLTNVTNLQTCYEELNLRVTSCGSWGEGLSPVVAAGAGAVLEMVEALVVPDDDLAAGDLGDELDGVVAVPADAEVLHDPERRPRRRAHQTERDGQALAVVHERAGLGVLVDVVEHVARVRHVPRRADLRVELPHLRVRLRPLGLNRRVLLPPPRPLLEDSARVAAGAELEVQRGDPVQDGRGDRGARPGREQAVGAPEGGQGPRVGAGLEERGLLLRLELFGAASLEQLVEQANGGLRAGFSTQMPELVAVESAIDGLR